MKEFLADFQVDTEHKEIEGFVPVSPVISM